jgi:hypothetical protein
MCHLSLEISHKKVAGFLSGESAFRVLVTLAQVIVLRGEETVGRTFTR